MSLFRRDSSLEVRQGLAAIRPRSQGAAMYLRSMMVYAAVGRDRRKLTMDWVDQVRAQCATYDREYAALWQAA